VKPTEVEKLLGPEVYSKVGGIAYLLGDVINFIFILGMEHQGPTQKYVGPADFLEMFEQFYILVDSVIAGIHGNERLALSFFTSDLDKSLAFFKSHIADFLLAENAEGAFVDVVSYIMSYSFFIKFFKVRSEGWAYGTAQSLIVLFSPLFSF
jgi:hypothetical protein